MEQNEKRNELGKRAGLIGIIINILLAGGKLAVGLITFSTTIIADALNNFTDGLSSVVTMIGFKLAQKPADADHPYGHARFEYLSGLLVSIMVIFVGYELAKSSIQKIITPQNIDFSIVGVIVLAVAVFVKAVLSVYNAKAAKKINSDALKATAVDCRNDAIITAFVLLSTLVERFSGLAIDGYTGLLVSLFILYSGVMLVKDTITPLLGKKNDAQLKQKIIDKIKDYPIVLGYHDLMIHDYGPGRSFCTIHFEVNYREDPICVHEFIDQFEREFLAEGVNLTVHYDPVVTDSYEVDLLKRETVAVLEEMDARLTVHDFRLILCDGFIKVLFDIPLPYDLVNEKQKIITIVNTALNDTGLGEYEADITFDSTDFN